MAETELEQQNRVQAARARRLGPRRKSRAEAVLSSVSADETASELLLMSGRRFAHKFGAEMCEQVIRLGREGYLYGELAAALGVSATQFGSWHLSIAGFRDALDVSVDECSAFWDAALLRVSERVQAGGIDAGVAEQMLASVRQRRSAAAAARHRCERLAAISRMLGGDY